MRKPNKLALFLFVPSVLLAQQTSVWTGVFTPEQAKRGQAVFAGKCARCHEGADVDGPPLSGTPFIDRWREDSLASLYNFIKEKMPQDNPGKLEQKEYVDVLTHLLNENHVTPGAKELTAEAIPTLLLVGQDGPKPLPANALVKVVGCLMQDDMAWVLAKAGPLSRIRGADTPTNPELAESMNKPLGSQKYELANIEDLAPGFTPQPNRDHKVLVEGVLVKRANAMRINLLAAGPVAPDCSK
jgi:mono/diheme cytochrome c family protein